MAHGMLAGPAGWGPTHTATMLPTRAAWPHPFGFSFGAVGKAEGTAKRRKKKKA